MIPAFLDTQRDALPLLEPVTDAVTVHAPRAYQQRAVAAFEEAEMLLEAILPEARIAHVGASSIPGAYSKGDVDICIEVPADRLMDALGVLAEAGFQRRPYALRSDLLCRLTAPPGAFAVPMTLQLVEAAPTPCFLVRFRDALCDDATLVVRYNALRLEAAPAGALAYRRAKAAFIRRVLGD